MRKNCFCDREKLLKFKAEGREFANFLRSLKSVHFKNTVMRYSLKTMTIFNNDFVMMSADVLLKKVPPSVVQLKGKHCQKPHCRNGVVDTFGHSFE